MAGNTVTVEYVGDVSRLEAANRRARRSLDDTGTAADRAGGRWRRVGEIAAGVFGGNLIERGLELAADYFNQAGEAASALEQAVGGTRAVFGEYNATVEAAAKTSADAVGLSEAAFRDATTTMGAQLKNLTGDVDFAADSAVDLVGIGADLAATFGGTTEEAVSALGAALRGEADPAERFGLLLSATAVNAERAEQGLGAAQTGTAEYAETIVGMIEEQAAANGAVGQFAREADTAAGKTQRLQAELENLKAEQGEVAAEAKVLTAQAKVYAAEVVGGVIPALAGQSVESDRATTSIANQATRIAGLTSGLTVGTEILGFFRRETDDTRSAQDRLTPATERLSGSTDTLAGDVADASDEVITFTEGLDTLREKVDRLITPVLNLSDAQIGFEEAIDDATQAAKDNGATLDVNTAKGRTNKRALDTLAESTWDYIDALIENGASTDDVNAKTERARGQFVRTATQMGLTKAEARKLADQYGLIPGTVNTEVKTKGFQSAFSKIDRIKQALDAIDDRVVRPGIQPGFGADGLGIGAFVDGGGTLMGVPESALVARAYRSIGSPGDVISGSRPGATTLSGNPSWHGVDRALDFWPATRGTALAIIARYGRVTKELITPWPDLGILNGRFHRFSDPVQAQHDGRTRPIHFHWAMEDGGVGTVTKPTVFLAGEAGREDFAFAPHRKGGMDALLEPRARDSRLVAQLDKQNDLLYHLTQLFEEMSRDMRGLRRDVRAGHVINLDIDRVAVAVDRRLGVGV